jgi:hypothetical protein
MAILGKIQQANTPQALREIVFSWLSRNAPEIGVHPEMSYENAAELANKVGYRHSAATVLQAAIAKSRAFPPATEQPVTPPTA